MSKLSTPFLRGPEWIAQQWDAARGSYLSDTIRMVVSLWSPTWRLQK